MPIRAFHNYSRLKDLRSASMPAELRSARLVAGSQHVLQGRKSGQPLRTRAREYWAAATGNGGGRVRVMVAGGAGFLGQVLCVDNLMTGKRENVVHLKGDFQFIEQDITERIPGGTRTVSSTWPGTAGPVGRGVQPEPGRGYYSPQGRRGCPSKEQGRESGG